MTPEEIRAARYAQWLAFARSLRPYQRDLVERALAGSPERDEIAAAAIATADREASR